MHTRWFSSSSAVVNAVRDMGLCVPATHEQRLEEKNGLWRYDYEGLRKTADVEADADSVFDAEQRGEISVNIATGAIRRLKPGITFKDESAEMCAATRETSSVASPTKLVWEIADDLCPDGYYTHEAREIKARIVAACVAKGVHESTAKTQVYRWAKARGY